MGIESLKMFLIYQKIFTVAVVSFIQNKCIRGETMAHITYEIPMLSARGIISYAEKQNDEFYNGMFQRETKVLEMLLKEIR